jgi:hypothetical protein
LAPKTDVLKAVFTRISLSGDQFVRGIRMTEAGGDSTEISVTSSAASKDVPAGF